MAGVKTHSVLSRTKSLKSIRGKSIRKNYDRPFQQLYDLVGLRVVCLLRSDIALIGQVIRQQFQVLSEDNKIDGASLEVFGYQSVHFIVQVPKSCSGPRYQGLHEIRFEIQARTLAMDAWSSLSHYLDYKSEADVPKDLRKDLFALSGLFYVADTHFELFYAERQKSKQSADKTVESTPLSDQELNLDTLSAFLHKHYPDREHTDSAGVSELLDEIAKVGYDTLEKLHEALESSAEAFQRYEKTDPPHAKEGMRYADVGAARLSLAILDPKYARGKYSKGDFQKFKRFILPRGKK